MQNELNQWVISLKLKKKFKWMMHNYTNAVTFAPALDCLFLIRLVCNLVGGFFDYCHN